MHKLLESLIPVAETVGRTFGKSCEVVLHDLTTPENSVVYVVNGTVTGRKKGQTFDHLLKFVLLNKNFRDDYTVNYIVETEDGRKVKSSSALIRDDEDEVIGMLCINYDLSVINRIKEELDVFLPPSCQETAPAGPEVRTDQNVSTIVDGLIDRIISDRKKRELTKQDNLEIIKFMDDKGIFLVKGAIDKVAACLGLSKVTIYGYLDIVRGKK